MSAPRLIELRVHRSAIDGGDGGIALDVVDSMVSNMISSNIGLKVIKFI